jgi:hypothetical protein
MGFATAAVKSRLIDHTILLAPAYGIYNLYITSQKSIGLL